MKIACFISPHGYGHAARAAGVMSAIHELDPGVSFEIFTAVPDWFFAESLTGAYVYHPVMTDVGLAQKTPLEQDLVETVRRLDRFLPFDPETIGQLAETVRAAQCGLVLCDISPMGIAVAERAGVPSILIENFTWDWIYEGYAGMVPGFRRHMDYLRKVFAAANHRIQAEPVCKPGHADLLVRPVSRKPRTSAPEIREALGIPLDAKAVIVTLGGIPLRQVLPDRLPGDKKMVVIMPGAADSLKKAGNFLLLPHHSGFYHPDLIRACDGVISKAGYSTLAETYYAGRPFGYISRTDFRESPVLETFIRSHMAGFPLSEKQFQTGRWMDRIEALLALPTIIRDEPNGADQAAAFILDLLE